MSAWDHLPNAQHIDRLMTHLKTHPEQGANRPAKYITPARNAAWKIISRRPQAKAWCAARDEVYSMGHSQAITCDVFLALIAYDDCAYILALPIGAIKVMASANIPAAMLLYPAMVAMQ